MIARMLDRLIDALGKVLGPEYIDTDAFYEIEAWQRPRSELDDLTDEMRRTG